MVPQHFSGKENLCNAKLSDGALLCPPPDVIDANQNKIIHSYDLTSEEQRMSLRDTILVALSCIVVLVLCVVLAARSYQSSRRGRYGNPRAICIALRRACFWGMWRRLEFMWWVCGLAWSCNAPSSAVIYSSSFLFFFLHRLSRQPWLNAICTPQTKQPLNVQHNPCPALANLCTWSRMSIGTAKSGIHLQQL